MKRELTREKRREKACAEYSVANILAVPGPDSTYQLAGATPVTRRQWIAGENLKHMNAARLVASALCQLLASTAIAHAAFALAPQPAQQPEIASWVHAQLNDTSFIRRSVALDRLQKAAPGDRRRAALIFANALNDTTRAVQLRALAGLRVLEAEAAPAIEALERMAGNARDPLQGSAISAIASIGVVAKHSVPLLLQLDTGSYQIRVQAAIALIQTGDTLAGTSALRRLIDSSAPGAVRLQSARTLAVLGDSVAIPVLIGFLLDSSFAQQSGAITALGTMGPKARAAIPALTAILGDTIPRRVSQGQASEVESAAAFAAWSLARIIPFHSVVSNTVLDPLYVAVADKPFSLRGDGLGVYAWGVDSVSAWIGSGLFLHLSPPSPGRGPLGPTRQGFRRSLSFDLSNPVAGSGAARRGIISDNEAYIWIWYQRDPASDRIITIREVAPSAAVHRIERVEMHFRINGVLHILHMGPFVEGQGGATVWFTGMNGVGTSTSQLTHPNPDVWTVIAPEGSTARLWSFEDRERPLDRGLYRFSLSMKFMSLPGGAMGSCVPALTCPGIGRH